MLGAVKPKSFKCTAVFDPRTASTLFSIIGGAVSGEAVVRGRSFFANRVGEMVAASRPSRCSTIRRTRDTSLASVYDGEGLACRRNVLIDSGELKAFVYDTVSARRAGTASTGSAVRGGIAGSPSAGCRALQLSPGDIDQAEIFRRVGNGVFVESLFGVHSGVNPVSGDFSVGVTGLMGLRRPAGRAGSGDYGGLDVAADAAGRRPRGQRPGVAPGECRWSERGDRQHRGLRRLVRGGGRRRGRRGGGRGRRGRCRTRLARRCGRRRPRRRGGRRR